MCLIAFAWKAHPRYPLIVAANRDEFLDRPAERARFWADAPNILAGRDLRAGGTWLGVTRQGRFAAITNHRDLRRAPRPHPPSRGAIVRRALDGALDPAGTAAYEGFHLLYGTRDALRYHTNLDGRDEAVTPGVHGLSNALLGTPWPKVLRAKGGLEALLAVDGPGLVQGLFALLADEAVAPDGLLPDTGLPMEMERAVSAVRIRTPHYGTRCSTVVLMDEEGGVRFQERTVPDGAAVAERFTVG